MLAKNKDLEFSKELLRKRCQLYVKMGYEKYGEGNHPNIKNNCKREFESSTRVFIKSLFYSSFNIHVCAI